MIRRVALFGLLVGLIAAPAVAGNFQLTMLTQGLIWAALGVAVWVLLYSSKLPPFGHAAFFGTGGYVVGLLTIHTGLDNLFALLGVGVAVACLIAIPIGLLTVKLGPVFFLLVTLAFAEMLHAISLRWRRLGGSDGLAGISRPDTWPVPMDLTQSSSLFYVVLTIVLLVLGVVVVLMRSPFGYVLIGIRDSPQRMAALGYNIRLYRTAIFAVSAGVAAVAGSLHTWLNRFVSPSELSGLVSARGLLIAVIGISTVLGPAIVGVALSLLESSLRSVTPHWPALLGLLYIAIGFLSLEDLSPAHTLLRLRVFVGRRFALATHRLSRESSQAGSVPRPPDESLALEEERCGPGIHAKPVDRPGTGGH